MKKILKYILIAVGIAFVSVVSRELTGLLYDSSSNQNINTVLAETVPKMNKMLPKMLAKNVRLDSVSSSDNMIIYHYTAVNLDAKRFKNDSTVLNNLRSKMYPTLKKNYCNNEKMKTLVKNDISADYNYYDRNGSLFSRFTVTPSQCQ